jgi:hypothetical protein
MKEIEKARLNVDRKHFVICVFDGGKVRGYP